MRIKIRNPLAATLICLCLLAPGGLARERFSKGTVEPADENLKQGLKLIREGNWESAIDSFKQAAYFSRNQYNPPAYKYLGLGYKATRQYAKAIETFKTFFQQTTENNPDVRIDLAECYINVQEWQKAQDELDRAMAEDAGNKNRWRQRYAMGELHEKMAANKREISDSRGELSSAIGFYEEAIEEKKNYTDAWMAKGRVEVKLGRTKQALRDYREILERGPLMHPNLEELYYNMGTCLAQHGDDQGALDHWHMAVEQNPDSYDSHLALASMLDKEKHFSSALKEYQATLRCSPKENPAEGQIMRRIEWIEQQIKPKEAPVNIRPSPSMRQQEQDDFNRKSVPLDTKMPTGKDAGF